MKRGKVFGCLKKMVIAIVLIFAVLTVLFLIGMSRHIGTVTFPDSHNKENAAILLSSPRRVILVAAHPDDAEFYSGATLAKMARQGDEIILLVLTT